MNGAPPAPGSAPAPARRVVVPHAATWTGRLAAGLIEALVRSIDATIRYRVEDPAQSLQTLRQAPVIFAIWHNRLALSPMLYHRYVVRHDGRRRMAAMVSASKDGGLLARVLERFQVEPVRGSSSRRGAQALLEMTSWAGRGYDLAITPDGPRGPRYAVQDGVVALAQVTGLPIFPIACQLRHKWQIKSWDRFQVPLPFTRCAVRPGAILRVPRDADDAQRERLRVELERRLREATVD